MFLISVGVKFLWDIVEMNKCEEKIFSNLKTLDVSFKFENITESLSVRVFITYYNAYKYTLYDTFIYSYA